MPIIIIVIITIYLLLISLVWQNMGDIDKTKKIVFIAVGIIAVFLITLIIFNISKINIAYQNKESERAVRNLIVPLFTGLNSLVIMPYISKTLNRLNEKEIEKEKFSKRILVILIIFLICITFECGYFKDIQKGIIQISNSSSQKGL